MTSDCAGVRFLRVRAISKSKKLKSSRSQTKQFFHSNFVLLWLQNCENRKTDQIPIDAIVLWVLFFDERRSSIVRGKMNEMNSENNQRILWHKNDSCQVRYLPWLLETLLEAPEQWHQECTGNHVNWMLKWDKIDWNTQTVRISCFGLLEFTGIVSCDLNFDAENHIRSSEINPEVSRSKINSLFYSSWQEFKIMIQSRNRKLLSICGYENGLEEPIR
jgi:hypothetical protein